MRSDLCDIKLYMADPTAVQMEGFGILFIPLSANFFVDICPCYHKSNDTYYVRTHKNDEIRPLRTYASQLDYYTLLVCNSMEVI